MVSSNMLLYLYSVIVDMEIKRKVYNFGENIRSVVVIVLTELYVNFSFSFKVIQSVAVLG